MGYLPCMGQGCILQCMLRGNQTEKSETNYFSDVCDISYLKTKQVKVAMSHSTLKMDRF